LGYAPGRKKRAKEGALSNGLVGAEGLNASAGAGGFFL